MPGERYRPAGALTDSESAAYLPGFFELALGSVIDSPRIVDAARSGAGLGWHEHTHEVHDGCERFFRPGYNAQLDRRVAARAGRGHREAGARSARRRRRLRPRRVDDPHGAGVPPLDLRRVRLRRGLDRDRTTAGARGGRADHARFDAAPAAAYGGAGYDLVTMFDCLHDMGATRDRPRRTSARRSRPTAPG
jgi:hypothetical protein